MGFISFFKKGYSHYVTRSDSVPPPLEILDTPHEDVPIKKYFIISKKDIISCDTTSRITCAQLTDYNISKEICNTYGHILLEYTCVGGGSSSSSSSWKIVN